LGTQMISKGLDFHNVTLIGVLAADMSLHIDDYRSAERTFQLVTQVCGRAGRGDIAGRAVIQTYDPENITLLYAKEHDYVNFYDNEIEIRKQLSYPPFCDIVNIVVTGTDEKKTANLTANLLEDLKNEIEVQKGNLYCIEIYGPTPAPISKIKEKYRWRLLMKCFWTKEIRNILKSVSDKFYDKNLKDYYLTVDVNPNSMF